MTYGNTFQVCVSQFYKDVTGCYIHLPVKLESVDNTNVKNV